MKEQTFRFVTLFAAVWAGIGALADDAAWIKSAGGTYDWTNTVNWLPSTTCPNGAGQSAYLANDIAGAITVQLRQNITLGRLVAGDAVASTGNYGFTFNNKSGESFVLTFDSGVSGVPAVFAGGSSATPTVKLDAPAVLQSDLVVSAGGTDANNHPNVAFNGPLDLNGRSIIFANGVAGQNQFSFELGALLTGGGTLVSNAQTVVSVTGSKTLAGRLVANRGAGRSPGSRQGAGPHLAHQLRGKGTV